MHWYKWVLAFLLGTVSVQGFAKEVAIFDSRKPVTLSKNDKSYIDFYINAGSEVGLKKGVIVTVRRSTSLYDAYQNQSPGDLKVEVGQIRIIHVQKGLSVGRIYKVFSREERPILDYDSIMVGDRLDLSTMKILKKKAKTETATKKTPVPRPEVMGPPESVEFASSLPNKTTIALPQLQ
ncbi:MAG: hypothetical protein KDD40_02040 [Bdellovibrionales bacterium]|nr:hypothetical protein [Bdellovibrionales bacterium]